MIKKKKHPLIALKNQFEERQKTPIFSFFPIPPESIFTEEKTAGPIEKMGLLILAGGMGTRLGYHGPKGCFELPFKHKKSLFKIHFQKILKKGGSLSIAIMTSPLNHEQTVNHFKKNNWFGLKEEQIDFFQQELMFMCDTQGELFFDKPHHWAKSPDGNGKAFHYFMQASIFDKWKSKGITHVQVMPVDNVLSNPFDTTLITLHEKTKNELIVPCIKRLGPKEKLGILGMDEKHLKVIEYSEGDEKIKIARHLDGTFVYSLGYIGIFSCSLAFIEGLQDKFETLQWHLAKKEAQRMFLSSGKWESKREKAYKFETFIFDLFPYAKNFCVLLKERSTSFAPLKNQMGPDSPETIVKKLER